MTDARPSSDADELRHLAEAVGTISGRCSLESDRTALIIAGTQLRLFAKHLDVAQGEMQYGCPYIEGDECPLEKHSFGPCLCANPVAQALAIPSTDREAGK